MKRVITTIMVLLYIGCCHAQHYPFKTWRNVSDLLDRSFYAINRLIKDDGYRFIERVESADGSAVHVYTDDRFENYYPDSTAKYDRFVVGERHNRIVLVGFTF